MGLELHESFLGQAGGALELVAGKHYRCDTANAEVRKDGSSAYKITRICLAPSKAAFKTVNARAGSFDGASHFVAPSKKRRAKPLSELYISQSKSLP